MCRRSHRRCRRESPKPSSLRNRLSHRPSQARPIRGGSRTCFSRPARQKRRPCRKRRLLPELPLVREPLPAAVAPPPVSVAPKPEPVAAAKIELAPAPPPVAAPPAQEPVAAFVPAAEKPNAAEINREADDKPSSSQVASRFDGLRSLVTVLGLSKMHQAKVREEPATKPAPTVGAAGEALSL